MDSKDVSRRTFLKCAGGTIVATGMGSVFPVFGHAQSKKVKFAYVEPLTGFSALQGQDHLRGLQLAVEEINSAGGIKSLGGATIELIGGDSETNPNVGIQVAERLVREKPAVMIGCENSAVTFPVTQVSERAKVNFIVDIAVANEITERGFKYVFRFFPTINQGCRKLGEHINTMAKDFNVPLKTVALLHENTLFGNSVSKALNRVLMEAGLDILAKLPYDEDAAVLDTEITKLKRLNPDVLIPTSYIPGAILMTKTMKAFDFAPKLYIGGTSAGHSLPAFIEGVGELSKFTMNSGNAEPWRNRPEYQEANKNYLKKFGAKEFNRTALFSYLAAKIGADALERCGSTDPDVLNEAIRKTRYQHHLITMPPINFDKTGQMPDANVVVEQVLFPEKGHSSNVWPAEYADKGASAVVPFPAWAGRSR